MGWKSAFLALLLTGLALAQEPLDARVDGPPLELIRLSPYVSSDPFPYVTPPVMHLRARLRAIERTCQQRGLMLHHNFTGLYGSGFLPANPVGNDLDGTVCVHLGHFKLDDPSVQARQLLSSIEQYLQVVDHEFSLHEAPEMAVLRFRLLGKDGLLKGRPVLQTRLANSLKDVREGRPHAVLIDSLYGLRVPTLFGPDESYIYETTRIELVSDQVRTTDWMTPGVRGFQVMFHFYCDLELPDGTVIEDFAMHPTFVPSGKVLRLQEDPLGVVPMDRESASFFSREALSSPASVARTRVEMMAHLMSEVDRNLEVGDSVKAMKRLYQGANAMAPSLPGDFRARLDRVVEPTLMNDDVQLCNEIKTLAELARKVVSRPPALTEYLPEFRLGRVLTRIEQDLGRYTRLHGGEAPSLQASIELVRDGKFPTNDQRKKLGETLEAVEKFGGAGLKKVMPPVAEVKSLRDTVQHRLEEAGLRPFAVYGLPDGSLGYLGSEPPTGTPWKYVRIDAPPLDKKGKPLPPSSLIWVRVGPGEEELLQALASERLTPVSYPETQVLRREARKRFLARFGAAGQKAWSASRTGGDGLLALLGTPQGEQLLERHLELIQAAPRASRALPGQPAVALERALRATSEQILLGLAVGRHSGGRRGLTVAQTQAAQRQLGDLQAVLTALGEREIPVTLARQQGDLPIYELRLPTGLVGELFARSRPEPGRQARISIRPGTPESLGMRLDYSMAVGAAVDLQFSDPRLDWGVHGGMPTDPLVSNHHFPDGLPDAWQRPHNPRERAELHKSFTAYVQGEFMPRVRLQN